MQPHTIVTDIVRDDDVCIGVLTLDRYTGEHKTEYSSRGTVLASGGLGGIYEHSTNPTGFNALGSSVALARRAGVQTSDLEYVQFHPTSLCIPNETRFLLTEALRGEGAILRDASGRAFAKDFHPDGELAPRDIVARGVFAESLLSEAKGVEHNAYLDITHRDADWLHKRFPTIQSHLAERGLDIAKDQLPVIPAAHYTCGGVTTDMQGRTSLAGLYAAGEAARTGLHGANRLASTSLLEGLVFGASVADFIGGNARGNELHKFSRELIDVMDKSNAGTKRKSNTTVQTNANTNRAIQLLSQVRRIMWDYVGLVRTSSRLSTAIDALSEIEAEATELHRIRPSIDTSGVRDAACAGKAVAEASAANPNSAGTHYVVPDDDSEDFSDDEENTALAR
jgi:L-aspartate oxidase